MLSCKKPLLGRLLLTEAAKPAMMAVQNENAMADEDRGSNYLRLALGAGVLAATAVGLAVFVPRRRWVAMAEPFRAALKSPTAMAMTGWAVGLWNRATQAGPPVFDDLRPFDEF
jgi:hypothetical protein